MSLGGETCLPFPNSVLRLLKRLEKGPANMSGTKVYKAQVAQPLAKKHFLNTALHRQNSDIESFSPLDCSAGISSSSTSCHDKVKGKLYLASIFC